MNHTEPIEWEPPYPLGIGVERAIKQNKFAALEQLEQATQLIVENTPQDRWPAWAVFWLWGFQSQASRDEYEIFLQAVRSRIDTRLARGEW